MSSANRLLEQARAGNFEVEKVISADRILEQCKDLLAQRGKGYDNGEQRLMQTIAETYSQVTQSEFNEFDGYTFMVCLKLARMQADRFTADHYIDLINYVALMGESTLPGPPGAIGNEEDDEGTFL